MKVYFILLFFLTGILIIFSCNNEPECCTPISVEWTINKDTTYVGIEDDVEFQIKLVPDLIEKVSPTKLIIKEKDVTLDSVEFFNQSTPSHKFIYHVNKDEVPRKVELFMIVYDNKNKYTTEFAGFVLAKYPVPSISNGNGMLFYSSISLNYNMMLVFNDTSCYVADANNNFADIAFLWQDNYGYTLCSPDAKTIETIFSLSEIEYDLTNKKHTSIMKYNSPFENISKETINEIEVTENDLHRQGSGVEELIENDVIAFQLSDDRKGVIKVTGITKINKAINFEVFFQDSAYIYK